MLEREAIQKYPTTLLRDTNPTFDLTNCLHRTDINLTNCFTQPCDRTGDLIETSIDAARFSILARLSRSTS
jgi:hypothetical protein